VENYRGICLLNEHYEIYSRTVNEKWKEKAEKLFRYARMDPEKRELESIHCLAGNYLYGKTDGSLISKPI
jgi:hypothetical protein